MLESPLPTSPLVKCIICSKKIDTAELEEPDMSNGYPDYVGNPEDTSCEVREGVWVCSTACGEEHDRRSGWPSS